MMQIANEQDCSLNKIDYWMRRYKIPRRGRSEAGYVYRNPDGDPFTIKSTLTPDEAAVFALGIGLYWGEGTKASKNAVRIGNSDPGILLAFIDFLQTIYSVPKDKLKFGIQIFSDMDTEVAIQYWCERLNIKRSQFYAPHVTISGKIGTYRKKSSHGVVTLYFHNTKLQQILVDHINKMPR